MITFETKKHDQLADKLLQKRPCDPQGKWVLQYTIDVIKNCQKKCALEWVFFNGKKRARFR